MPEPTQLLDADLVVVGAGGAGLFTALTAAENGGRVVLVSATPLAQTASYWAQGGLAAALAIDDSPELHCEDTERAGRGAVRRSAAIQLCREAPGIVRELERFGVRFDSDRNGDLSLGLEGGHSRRRVVHAGGSATGRRVVRTLSAIVVEQEPIAVIERARACAVWTVDGRAVGIVLEDGRAIRARGVVLATGGMAALWSRTTNPPGSQGQGVTLAREAGAALADLEFMQFHPTAVTGIPGREGFLVTEAIRGEGATLHDPSGARFVDELAPRDEVSRAIWNVMTENGVGHVSLDMRSVDPDVFPNVVGALRESGLDPATELVPVAPASHYGMGGVVTDLEGAATVPGLYVVGETACTGLHGANRLASNSLTECFVQGKRAALAAIAEPDLARGAAPVTAPAPHPIAPPTAATRDALWRDAGLVRDADGLEHLLDDEHPLARLIAESALARTESRGAHQRSDFHETDHNFDGSHGVVMGDAPPRFETWS
jgi:L-aspartate oxidase